MTSNNEYYQQILNVVSGETISTYETTLNLMKKICLAYGCTYSSAQCSNKYLKDFAEASIGTTYLENKLNIEYLHDIALNFYPLTDVGTENYYLGIIADYITVTPKLHTDLTIDVPLVLVYSDEFDITGVLTDENDDPVENANIDLLVGNTIVDTATTDSTGTVEFTQAPVSMGNHTFQLVYTGDTEHYSTSSSTVSRTINKETSVLNVSLPLDGANYYDYENIAVTGTLYDNDGELINNAVVKVYNGSTLLESVNVSNGSFSISNLSDIAGTLGDYTLTITYEGNDYYTASSVNRTIHIVEEILYDGISLSSDKSILSYYDSESATLTAQLKNGTSDVAISGVAIEWFVDGVSQGSINTNNSGRSVFTYNSAGVGDVTIEAKLGTSSSETYELEDVSLYDDSSIDKTSNYSITNLNSHTFSTDHYEARRTIGSSPASTYYSLIYPTLDLPTDFEMSVDMYALSKETDKQFGLCISNTYTETYTGTNQCFLYANSNRTALGYRVSGSLTNYGESSSYSINTWYTFKIKVVGTTVTTQILDGSTVIQSWSGTLSNIQSWKKVMLITGGQSNTIRWKNFKIKPL